MIYKVLLTQQGEGCDYSISCGTDLVNIEAKNIEEATEKLTSLIEEVYNHDMAMIESAEIFEIRNSAIVDVSSIYSYINNKEKDAENKKNEDDERTEFERLKKKFS